MTIRISVFLIVLATAASDLAEAKGPFIISSTSVGPISGKTTFEASAIRKAFPGYDVSEDQDGYEDQSWSVFEVAKDGKTLLVIAPQHDKKSAIAEVKIKDPAARTVDKIKIGNSYLSLNKSMKLGQCEPGFEQESGFVFCDSALAENITFVFKTRNPKTEGKLPPEKELNSYKISEIRWSPSSKQ